MKIYKIPKELKAIIFDIDSTLYTNAKYAFEQVDVQVRYYASLHNMTNEEARNLVSDYRKKWALDHNGQKISLGNTLKAFGVPIAESIKWRETLIEPADFLSKDEKLIEVIKELDKKFKMICVTNNPVLPARKTLEALGISEYIKDIIGLDTCGVSKPAIEPYKLAVEKCGCKAENCISIGDRYDIDLALPLEMGMGAIEVAGVTDVYELVKVFSCFFESSTV